MRLSNAQLKALDERLFDYPYVMSNIAHRKLELQTAIKHDDNIGGGKGNTVSKPTERIIALWSDDARIKSLEIFEKAVRATIAELDDELKSIFELRWSKGSRNTWEEIADKLHISRMGIYRKRKRILSIFAEKSGM